MTRTAIAVMTFAMFLTVLIDFPLYVYIIPYLDFIRK